MAKTLFQELIRIRPETNTIFGTSENKVQELTSRAIKVADDRKRIVIESYAERSGTVQRIIDGETTFCELGKPIIQQSEKLEEKLKSKFPLRFVSRREILGKDSRNLGDIRESVEYLSGQDIIDTRNYFSSGFILPKAMPRIAEKIINSFPSVNPVIFFSGLILTLSIGLAYFGEKYRLFNSLTKNHNSEAGFYIGSFGGYFSYLLLTAVKDSDINRLSNERNHFSQALSFMDEEVQRLYDCKSKS
jgi:hypothetical protein